MTKRFVVHLVAFLSTICVVAEWGMGEAAPARVGSGPAERTVSQRAKPQTRPARRLFPIQWVNRSKELPPGVEHRILRSRCMNRDVGYCVYTPPDYAGSDKRYPVLYWLHGLPGNELLGRPHAAELHEAIVRKQIPPMIMVLVNGGRGSMYCDSKDGTIMPDTMIVKELIPYIDGHYRTIAKREARVIEGFSMGGFGALKFAFKYPELFCSVVGGAPALIEWESMSKRPTIADRIFGGDGKAFTNEHPATWLKKNADKIRGKLRIRIVIGDEDGLKPYNDKMCELLDKLKIPYEYEVLKGLGHSRGKVYKRAGLKGFMFQAESLAEAEKNQ